MFNTNKMKYKVKFDDYGIKTYKIFFTTKVGDTISLFVKTKTTHCGTRRDQKLSLNRISHRYTDFAKHSNSSKSRKVMIQLNSITRFLFL